MVRPRAVVSDSWQSGGPWVWWFLSNLRLDRNSAIGDLGNSDGRSRVCVGNKSQLVRNRFELPSLLDSEHLT
jgi:hypothetical protein